MLSTHHRQWKVKEMNEFRANVFPKYYKVIEELDKQQARRELYDEIIAKMKR